MANHLVISLRDWIQARARETMKRLGISIARTFQLTKWSISWLALIFLFQYRYRNRELLASLHDRWLVSHDLSRIWWYIGYDVRANIARHIISNYLFYQIEYIRDGIENCGGGEGEWINASCGPNALIRYFLFGADRRFHQEVSACYYQDLDGQEQCWLTEDFGLPVFHVGITGLHFGHGVCAIQLREDHENFYSYIFFQYNNDNIMPGDPQMPCRINEEDVEVSITEIEGFFAPGGIISRGDIVRWRLRKINQRCEIERV